MARAIWNGVVIAESDATVVVEGNHYFPPEVLRRAHQLCDLAQPDHAHRRDPGGLDRPCDQSHRLVADPSGRCQQHRIDLLLVQPPRHLRRGRSDTITVKISAGQTRQRRDL